MRHIDKALSLLLSLIMMMNMSVTMAEAKKNVSEIRELPEVNVMINGIIVNFNDSVPVMQNDRLLIPIRTVLETMGAVVDWNQEKQEIAISRKDYEVKLTIQSNVAFINGQEIPIDVPAALYKDRTYIPLRFVGEAFGGTVDWNEQSQTATIILPEKTIEEVTDIRVFLNDQPLDLEQFSLLKDGRIYLPLEAVFYSLDQDMYWSKEGNEIFVQIDGASVKLFVNENVAVINGEEVETESFPIEYNGNVYAPIRLVAEALGGIAHYITETKEIYLYINRPKFISNFLEKEWVEFVQPVNVPKASLVGSRRLMVSDNPEILNSNTIPADDVTLWQDTVKENKEAIDHRIFGWHINKLDKNVRIGITIENLSSANDIKITSAKGMNRTSPNTWANYDVGLPIAETVLSDRLMKIKLDNPVIKAGQILLLQSYTLDQENIIGFLNDLTIEKTSGTGGLHYRIRTVLSQSEGDLTAIKTDPVPVDKENAHPRGVWPSSEIVTELPVYQVGSKEIAYSLSNGITDHLMSQSASMDQIHSVQNPGHYGAVYKVKIPVSNLTGDTKTIRIRIGGRGGLYSGAVKTPNGVFITPILEPFKEAVKVMDFEVSGTQSVIELELMHAGGSALSMALDIMTLEEE